MKLIFLGKKLKPVEGPHNLYFSACSFILCHSKVPGTWQLTRFLPSPKKGGEKEKQKKKLCQK